MSDTKTILAVDDSMLTRARFVAAPLREAGYRVEEAANGALGLEAFKRVEPDLVITDLLMPEMDGFEFIEALRGEGHTTPVIVVSADIQKTSRDRVERGGVAGFLNKPFDKEELLATVERALAGAPAQEAAACN